MDQMVHQRKQEEEEEKKRQVAFAAQRAERAKVKQESLNKLQETWMTQAQAVALSKPNGKRGKGGKKAEEAPQYESASDVDDPGVGSENSEERAVQADRYGDGSGTSDVQPPLPSSNLKDIGLSSSSDDDIGGDKEDDVSPGRKRKWDIDDNGVEPSSKKFAVGD